VSPVGDTPRSGTRAGDDDVGSRTLTAPIAVTGGAVAFAVGGLLAFTLAGSVQSEAERDCPRRPSCDSEQQQVRTLDAVALTGFIAAAALGGLAVVLWSSRSPTRAAYTAPAFVGTF